MSLNLKADKVELWQTPTWVTYICYSNDDGGWEGILYRYEQWAWSHTQGAWKSEDELKAMVESVRDHMAKVKAAGPLKFRIE